MATSVKPGYIVIYTPYITRNGKRIYASSFGKKAFRLEIPANKYRRKFNPENKKEIYLPESLFLCYNTNIKIFANTK